MNYRRVKLNAQSSASNHQTATALEYAPGQEGAPRVIASGKGKIAEQILTLAREHDVPIYEDSALAAALAAVDLGEEIPSELYLVVAEVLVYIYRVSGRAVHHGS